jgi:hypothetical protein
MHYGLLAGAALVALLFLMEAIAQAADARPWRDKIIGVASSVAGALAFGAMTAPMYATARSLGQRLVAIGPEGLRLKLPGNLWTQGLERRFEWQEISNISCELDGRKPVCKFQADEHIFTLTRSNSPSPEIVARLLAEGKRGTSTPSKGAA